MTPTRTQGVALLTTVMVLALLEQGTESVDTDETTPED